MRLQYFDPNNLSIVLFSLCRHCFLIQSKVFPSQAESRISIKHDNKWLMSNFLGGVYNAPNPQKLWQDGTKTMVERGPFLLLPIMHAFHGLHALIPSLTTSLLLVPKEGLRITWRWMMNTEQWAGGEKNDHAKKVLTSTIIHPMDC